MSPNPGAVETAKATALLSPLPLVQHRRRLAKLSGSVVLLAGILLLFCGLLLFVPMRTAVQIGADEGFELAKATLRLHSFELYSDIWWDHPPLHPFLMAQVVERASPSVLGPRLVTVGLSLLLLACFFWLVRHVATCSSVRESAPSQCEGNLSRLTSAATIQGSNALGVWTAALATVLLIASPGFLELSSSCMMEIPALAPAVAGLCVLLAGRPRKWRFSEVLAGMMFGIALAMKLIGVIYLPLAGLILWFRRSGDDRVQVQADSRGYGYPYHARPLPGALGAFGVSLALTFLAIVITIDRGAFLLHLQQSWSAHFAGAQSFEYGSPETYRFPLGLLLKNWDLTLPAAGGVAFLIWNYVRRSGSSVRPTRSGGGEEGACGLAAVSDSRTALVPVAWLALVLVVFITHKPWWSYYYIHIAIPLCWCAAIGIASVWMTLLGSSNARRKRRTMTKRHQRFRVARAHRLSLLAIVLIVYAVTAIPWMTARVYLQITGIRHSPQTYHAIVLREIDRFKPFTEWIYTDNLTYSFHAGIPVPPPLAVVSLKRLWSGDMTNERVDAEMRRFAPGLIALRNDSREVPFQEFLQAEYRLVYYDSENRLYAHRTIANQPDL